MDSAGFLCNGFRQTMLKLLVIYFSHLNGVQVVAGSNPVAPTKKKTNRTVELAKLILAVFLFVNLPQQP